MTNHLHGLAVEGKSPRGGLLQVVSIRPAGVLLAGGQMEITTQGPDSRGFPLGFIQASAQPGTEASQGIDANSFHQPVLLNRTRPEMSSASLFSSCCRTRKRN